MIHQVFHAKFQYIDHPSFSNAVPKNLTIKGMPSVLHKIYIAGNLVLTTELKT